MYKAKEESGIQVLFVTSTEHFTKFASDVAKKIADLHSISVIDSYNYYNEPHGKLISDYLN